MVRRRRCGCRPRGGRRRRRRRGGSRMRTDAARRGRRSDASRGRAESALDGADAIRALRRRPRRRRARRIRALRASQRRRADLATPRPGPVPVPVRPASRRVSRPAACLRRRGRRGSSRPARSRVRVVRIAAGRRPPAAVAARCSAATPRSVGESRRSSSCAPLADSCAMSRRVLASMRRINGSAFSGHRDAYAEKSARAPDRTSGDPSATMDRIADSTASWLRAPPRVSHSRITRRSHPVAWHRSFTLLSLLAASHSLGMRCLA